MKSILENERGEISLNWGVDMSVQITVRDHGPISKPFAGNSEATAHLKTPETMRWLAGQLLSAADTLERKETQ